MSQTDERAGGFDAIPQPIDRSWIVVERIGRSIGAAIVLGTSFAALVPLTVLAPFPFAVAVAAWVLWVVLGVLLAFRALIWPAIEWKHIRYAVSPREIRIERGVWWRSVSTVPRNRVQHTDVNQGPVERLFELATLTVYTAGTEYASVSLGGLRHADASAVRDRLLGSRDDDAV